MISAIEAVLAVQEDSWIPTHLKGPSYFGANDEWMYLRSDHPNMCDTCASYHLTTYFGSELRSVFPWLEVIDENQIYPRVHPNCECLLTRSFPVVDYEKPLPQAFTGKDVDKSKIKSEIELPEDYYDDDLPWELIALGVIFKPKPKIGKKEQENAET